MAGALAWKVDSNEIIKYTVHVTDIIPSLQYVVFRVPRYCTVLTKKVAANDDDDDDDDERRLLTVRV